MSDWTVHVVDESGRELAVMPAVCVWPEDRSKHAYELRCAVGTVRATGVGYTLYVRFRGNNIWSERIHSKGQVHRGTKCQITNAPDPWCLSYEGLIASHSMYTDGEDLDCVRTVEKKKVVVLGQRFTVELIKGLPMQLDVSVEPFKARVIAEPGKPARAILQLDGETVFDEQAPTLDALLPRLEHGVRWWKERAVKKPSRSNVDPRTLPN